MVNERARVLRVVCLAAISLVTVLLLASSAVAQTPQEVCGARIATCGEECYRIRDEGAAKNCAEHGNYSGCALDAMGCSFRECEFAFAKDFCAAPGYQACAEGPVATYQACLVSCNDKVRAATSYGEKLGVLGNCPKDCAAPFTEAILACKAAACDPKCEAEGHATGTWYPRDLPRWESCQCADATPTAAAKILTPPVAMAGADVTVSEDQQVVLSSEGSYDPDGRIVFTYWYWNETQIAVSSRTEPRWFPVGTNLVTLQVVDNDGLIGEDTVVVTVTARQAPAEACSSICKQTLGDAAVGTGRPPDCKCSCPPGYRVSPTTGLCEEFSCTDSCREGMGEGADGTGTYPACDCACMEGYTRNADTGQCDPTTCPTYCQDLRGEQGVGTGVYPACECGCAEGYRVDLITEQCVPATCEWKCRNEYGLHATGTGEYPDCTCGCERPYKPNEEAKRCELDCPLHCTDTFGPNAVATGTDPDCKCECDAARGYRWNEEHTACVTNCDLDGKCDQNDGEKCYNCKDCECTTAPWTACNPNPAQPMREIPYENREGCYVPNVMAEQVQNCEQAAAEYRSIEDAFLAFLSWQMKRTTAPIQVDWDPRSRTSGLSSNLGKWLVKLGYFDANGVPNPGASVVGEGPFRVFQMRMASIKSRCDSLCGGACPEARGSFGAVAGSDHLRRERDRITRQNGAAVNVSPGSTVYAPGGVSQVVLPNGQAVFQSEFVVIVADDGSAIIHLLDGQATYVSFAGETASFIGPATLEIDARGTPASFVRPLDVAGLDRWWENPVFWEKEGETLAPGLLIGLGVAALAGLVGMVWGISRRNWPVAVVGGGFLVVCALGAALGLVERF